MPQVLHGDSRELVTGIADASIDAVVTDPPYALNFMGKRWDTGALVHDVEFWRDLLRVLKPGGHLVAFGGTRTAHRMVCAIEDAGFEIRDTLAWVYGTGFPKSLDVSKAIDKAAGAERAVIGQSRYASRKPNGSAGVHSVGLSATPGCPVSAPATPEALEWAGYGTALKPAYEPICLARKSLTGTVAETLLEHRTGALNIDGCRIAGEASPAASRRATAARTGNAPCHPGEYTRPLTDRTSPERYMSERPGEQLGRWPANLAHDGSDEVLEHFPVTHSGALRPYREAHANRSSYGFDRQKTYTAPADTGSAARFFYCAKANKADRWGTRHATVKPIRLMRWLVRLVTPPGGLILDPFAGSGSTGIAAHLEGFDYTLIEREAEHIGEIAARLEHFASSAEGGAT